MPTMNDRRRLRPAELTGWALAYGYADDSGREIVAVDIGPRASEESVWQLAVGGFTTDRERSSAKTEMIKGGAVAYQCKVAPL